MRSPSLTFGVGLNDEAFTLSLLTAVGESGVDDAFAAVVPEFVRIGATGGCVPFAAGVLPDGVVDCLLPLKGGIGWMNIEIRLPFAASLEGGLEDDVFTSAEALEPAAVG